MNRAVIDAARCEPLAARAATGDDAAFKQLVEHLWPAWLLIVRSSRGIARLGGSDDQVHDVLTRLVDRLAPRGSNGLRLYAPWHDRHPEKTFEDWIRIVTTNLVRDYVREQRAGQSAPDGDPDPTVLVNEFASSPLLERLGTRPPFTAAQTARQLLEFAAAKLDAEGYRALTLWIEGATFEEIGGEVANCDAERARKLVRSAVAVLRRQFGGGEGGEDSA